MTQTEREQQRMNIVMAFAAGAGAATLWQMGYSEGIGTAAFGAVMGGMAGTLVGGASVLVVRIVGFGLRVHRECKNFG